LQDLSYTYDPAGNITHIRDDAQQTIYFRNRLVEPSNDYIYDAIYRLIEATGREHLGQIGGTPIPHTYNDRPRTGIDWSANDGNAMGTYREQYFYDEARNFIEMIHRGSDPANPGWTRAYTHDEDSLLENGKKSNRLTRTTLNPNSPNHWDEDYAHDPHGNMTRMPQLQAMQWDFKDRLLMTQRQAVNGQDEDGLQRQGERTYYVYDAAGQRARKVTELASGQLKEERVYLGGFEIYRRRGVNAVVRETLHIMDDKQRISLVETRVEGNDGSPAQLIRYQLGNHLGSASLELDQQAQIISYEEYYPYGSTSYQAVRSRTETPKRYRYTGKERDEESGLYYHGARYYAPWLGRWTSRDLAGDSPANSCYVYVRNNPIFFHDPDGNIPAPYELAEYVQDGPGEKFVSDTTTLPHLLADYLTAKLPSGDGFLASAARYTGVGLATVVTSAIDIAAGVAGTLSDPGLAARGLIRGVLTVGTASAEGVEEIDRGNILSGSAKITTDVSFVLSTAFGGVETARSLEIPWTKPLASSQVSTARRAETNAETTYLKTRNKGGGTFDSEKLKRIQRALDKRGEGVEISVSKANLRLLKKEEAAALYDPAKRKLIFGPNPTRLQVIEELKHLGQHRKTGFGPVNKLQSNIWDIEAKEQILQLKSLRLKPSEIEHLMVQKKYHEINVAALTQIGRELTPDEFADMMKESGWKEKKGK
jgi:RHS repeat-associated protein